MKTVSCLRSVCLSACLPPAAVRQAKEEAGEVRRLVITAGLNKETRPELPVLSQPYCAGNDAI